MNVVLIDRNNAEAVLQNIASHMNEKGNKELASAFYAAAEVINHQPVIRCKPVTYAHWEQRKDGLFCSACNSKADYKQYNEDGTVEFYDICPNCGSFMKGE